jgi:hypothetical protein
MKSAKKVECDFMISSVVEQEKLPIGALPLVNAFGLEFNL